MRLRVWILALIVIAIDCTTTTVGATTKPSVNSAPFLLNTELLRGGLVSARRAPRESYKEAAENFQRTRTNRPGPLYLSDSVFDARIPLAKTKLSDIPEWSSRDDIERIFRLIRDLRFLRDPEHASFPRRLPWMFPDDGCFARAEMAARLLVQYGQPTPAKIFAFGDLVATSSNSPTGSVEWWYHVVIGYRVGKDVIVFDPSIEPKKPLLFDEWLTRMNPNGDPIEISLCNEKAFDPDSNCDGDYKVSESRLTAIQEPFLIEEWHRMVQLNRNPEEVLGRSPPWRAQ